MVLYFFVWKFYYLAGHRTKLFFSPEILGYSGTHFFAKEEPIDPVAPKITFFIIKNNIIKGYLHANNDACNI